MRRSGEKAEEHLPHALALPAGPAFVSFSRDPGPVTLPDRLAALERRALPGGLTLLVAGDRRARRRGLAHLPPGALPEDHALVFERCRSVHTIGMRFALDLLWIDGDGVPVRIDRAVAPRRLRTCLGARGVIEAAAGTGERFAAGLARAALPRDH